MLIHYTEGKARETRYQMWVVLAVAATGVAGLAFVHRSTEGFGSSLAYCVGLIAMIAVVVELRTRGLLAQAGKPVLDFGDRAFLYWRKTEGPPEEISYAEVLTYYSTLLTSGDGEPEAFVTIEFRKRRRIRLRSANLDIGPQQFLTLVKLKLDAALP